MNPFDKLKLAEKVCLVVEFGDFLMSIEYYDYRVHLYGLNGHFIELHQNLDTRVIEKAMVASYGEIDKYLSRITISDLVTII